ncbi:hypothetical protein ES703_122724 [subsurface metagenome]
MGLLILFGMVLFHVIRFKQWRRLIILCGVYVFCDGLASILMYPEQAVAEHIPRVLRMIVGTTLMVLGSKSMSISPKLKYNVKKKE